jgi:hypothetical protein
VSGGPVIGEQEKAAVLSRLASYPNLRFTKRDLCLLTGFSERVIRASIGALVVDGHPIVTDREQGGYLLTQDRELIEIEVARLRSHGGEIQRRASALEAFLEGK